MPVTAVQRVPRPGPVKASVGAGVGVPCDAVTTTGAVVVVVVVGAVVVVEVVDVVVVVGSGVTAQHRVGAPASLSGARAVRTVPSSPALVSYDHRASTVAEAGLPMQVAGKLMP